MHAFTSDVGRGRFEKSLTAYTEAERTTVPADSMKSYSPRDKAYASQAMRVRAKP